jgi:hypothetical protein
MSDVNTLLSERLNKSPKTSKMMALAQKSASGNLNGFTGIFAVTELSSMETAALEGLLTHFATASVDVQKDLQALVTLTSEVKAISNQAAILHGERIKRAHSILTAYREGAFTAWLVEAYGNRQTPYNLWHYYEFYQATPKELRAKLETMPRQAIYTLASREGRFETKQKIVRDYAGETKSELLNQIRLKFPLSHGDKRADSPAESALKVLQRVHEDLKTHQSRLTPEQRRQLLEVINAIRKLL